MDAQDFEIFYPRLADELRQFEVDAMPGWVQTPRGLRPARQVLPEVAFATMLFAAVMVWLVGLTRWDWAVWVWIPAVVGGLLVMRGADRTLRSARTLVTYWWAGRR